MEFIGPIQRIKNVARDIRIGGKILGGTIETKFADVGAKATANSSYEMVEDIFNQIIVYDDDVLVDVGCGKGRVLNSWIKLYPKNKKIGIEIDGDVAEFTRNRLKKYSNCEIITGNILNSIPKDGTIFFMFNPFNENVLREFREKLEKSEAKEIIIVYLLCAHINVFEEGEMWKVDYIQGRKHKIHPTAIITNRQRTDVRPRFRK